MRLTKNIFILITLFVLISCSNTNDISKSTGWQYNSVEQGGFEVNLNVKDQNTGPGLLFIEGGRFTMGRVEEDVMSDWNNISKTVTVSSFYLDETEVRNMDYLEYLHWIKRYFVNENSPYFLGTSRPEIYEKALPDTLVWRDKLGENEIFINNYLRHPSYRDYPVVGVSWEQANNYCRWRTDRVNERILINTCILKDDLELIDGYPFSTESYLNGKYEGIIACEIKVLDKSRDEKTRRAKREDGILLPNYRLPTEAEWEHAALGYIGNNIGENHEERKIYPWNGSGVRNNSKKNQGKIMANFKRGRGDNMGVSGSLNDNADITAPVKSYWPNDYGLYNMAGNVSEWVADVYRPLIEQTSTTDHRPFRGNIFTTQQKNEDGEFIIDPQGYIRDTLVDSKSNIYRRNYKKADNINYLDGDIESQMGSTTKDIDENSDEDKSTIDIDKRNKGQDDDGNNQNIRNTGNSNEMYSYGETTLISDKARVYKGGSWKDRAYWLNPGTRRFLDQTLATDCIGFRCAMDRVGPPQSDLKQNKRREVDYSKAKQ